MFVSQRYVYILYRYILAQKSECVGFINTLKSTPENRFFEYQSRAYEYNTLVTSHIFLYSFMCVWYFRNCLKCLICFDMCALRNEHGPTIQIYSNRAFGESLKSRIMELDLSWEKEKYCIEIQFVRFDCQK